MFRERVGGTGLTRGDYDLGKINYYNLAAVGVKNGPHLAKLS